MNTYQEHILEHYHNPQNWGLLDSATHNSTVHNPTCGDTLEFSLFFEDGIVKKVGWTGEGCAISLASASLLSGEIVEKKEADLLALTSEDVLRLVNLTLSPGRLKCGILSLEALHQALSTTKK